MGGKEEIPGLGFSRDIDMGYAKLASRLQDYLNSIELKELTSGYVKIVELKLYEKQGLSNTIYLLKVEADDGFTGEFILRVYPGNGGKAFKEFKILSVLHSKGVPVPRVYGFDKSGEVLGKSFIVMEKIQHSPVADYYEFIDAAAKSLVGIHSITPSEVGDVLKIKKDYPTGDLKEVKALMIISMLTTLENPMVFARLFNRARKLEDSRVEARLRLIHGDYGFDNMVYSNGKAYVIDWEGAEIAEPTFDVAYAFNFLDFDDKNSGRTSQKLSEAFIDSYERHGGSIVDFQFYRKLAALKLLAILEAVSHPGLIAFIAREFRRRTKAEDAKRFLEIFKKYLRSILSSEE
ncbi:phosphotransferase [Candidatus Bathyarchaeota archaeon]|nr:phosphotransferase [Candidatus Bathyarchaeota archaeon]MBS7613831.1 phosphotransferase [Candidatus Bathyarchaeota archaeon]MBS7617996.1 phosphotransferase [Candidatus Bathyarchaeota archaeon]